MACGENKGLWTCPPEAMLAFCDEHGAQMAEGEELFLAMHPLPVFGDGEELGLCVLNETGMGQRVLKTVEADHGHERDASITCLWTRR